MEDEGLAAPLLYALEQRAACLHKSTNRGRSRASYESIHYARTVELTLRALVDLLERLPPPCRRAWRAARVRDFNVGLQAGRLPHSCEFVLEPTTVERVARLGGRVVVTVYAPFPRPRTS